MVLQTSLKFLPPIHGLLIDISGTLLIGSSATPGAAQAITALRAARIPFRLCSNTSKESSDAVHDRMLAAGLDVRREEVWTSIGALRAVLKALDLKRPYMLLSKSALEECTCTGVPPGDVDDRASSSGSPPYDAVVVGLAPSLLDYPHLNTAFRILVGENRSRDASSSHAQPGLHPTRCPPLIALHKARYLEASDHALSLGPGPFVTALEDAARTSATVVGKPTRAFFEIVLHDLERDLDARREDRPGPQSTDIWIATPSSKNARSRRWEGIAVIGDDVVADLGEGAIDLGLWRVLVRTGKYRPGDEHHEDTPPPDQVCASFAEFVEILSEQRKASPS